MEALVLMGGFVYIGVLGFWVMGKIDRFVGEGGFLPDWDKEEKGEAVSKTEKPRHRATLIPPKIEPKQYG